MRSSEPFLVLFLACLLSLPLPVLHADTIKLGDTPEVVQTKLGKPTGKFTSGTEETFIYKNDRVEFLDGHVVSSSLLPNDDNIKAINVKNNAHQDISIEKAHQTPALSPQSNSQHEVEIAPKVVPEIRIGDTKASVIERLGQPPSDTTSGDHESFDYKTGTVKFVNGSVVEINIKPDVDSRTKPHLKGSSNTHRGNAPIARAPIINLKNSKGKEDISEKRPNQYQNQQSQQANESTVTEHTVPALTGRVVDQAGLLKSEDAARVEKAILELEHTTGGQMVVLTVSTINGENLEHFSNRVGETWKIGYNGMDNGALLVVVNDSHAFHLDIGSGWVNKINNACTSHIFNVMESFFRINRYVEGLEYAVRQVQEKVASSESSVSDPRGPNVSVPLMVPEQLTTHAHQPQSGRDWTHNIGVIALLIIPLLIGGLIAAINVKGINVAIERFAAWAKQRQQRTEQGWFSKYIVNPLLWMVTTFCDWTDGIAHGGLKTGIRVMASLYAMAFWLMILYVAFMIVVGIIVTILVLYVMLRIIAGSKYQGFERGKPTRDSSAYTRTSMHDGHSEEKKGFFGREYMQYYDKNGNEIATEEVKEKLFGGKYVQCYDKDGKEIGTKELKKTFFGGKYIQQDDEDGNAVGTSEPKKRVFGETYIEHHDNDGNTIGTSEKKTKFFGGKYIENKPK